MSCTFAADPAPRPHGLPRRGGITRRAHAHRRSLFDQKRRILRAGAQETVIQALGDIREALQSRERCPEVTVEVNLPIALAMLVGHELRWTTQVKVTINTVKPGTSEMLVVEPAPTVRRDWPTSRVHDLPGAGPVVLAVSVGSEIGAAATRWAADNDARGFEALHIDRDPASDPLDADDIRALAAHIVKRLNELQADGRPKHLLLRGPAALGTAIGLAANASGPTYVSFYDCHDYYVGGLWIG